MIVKKGKDFATLPLVATGSYMVWNSARGITMNIRFSAGISDFILRTALPEDGIQGCQNPRDNDGADHECRRTAEHGRIYLNDTCLLFAAFVQQ